MLPSSTPSTLPPANLAPIDQYYDALAADYDHDRFGNSYGRYLHALEHAALAHWLAPIPARAVADMGCGTGRFLAFAQIGVDASAEMLKVAAAKWPDRLLLHAALPNIPLPSASLQAVLSLHVLMHLPLPLVEQSIREFARLVQPGGRLIFDIPSLERRALSRRPASGWHGDTAADRAMVLRWLGSEWQLSEQRGLLCLPIHRLPKPLRGLLRVLRPLDRWLGTTRLQRYASYHLLLAIRV